MKQKTSDLERKEKEEWCRNRQAATTDINTCSVLEWGGGGCSVRQGQETLGLKPITNTRISSHVHTAF